MSALPYSTILWMISSTAAVAAFQGPILSPSIRSRTGICDSRIITICEERGLLSSSSSWHSVSMRRPRSRTLIPLLATSGSNNKDGNNNNNNNKDKKKNQQNSFPRDRFYDFDYDNFDDDDDDDLEDEEFLRRGLAHLEDLEDILAELEEYDLELQARDGEVNGVSDKYSMTGKSSNMNDSDNDDDDDLMMWDEDSLEELLGNIQDDDDDDEDTYLSMNPRRRVVDEKNNDIYQESGAANLENALLQGVVPVSAGVGSDGLPGDFGFDPLRLADKDWFYITQQKILQAIPKRKVDDDDEENGEQQQNKMQPTALNKPSATAAKSHVRPKALILRDYREAEIRHGRLAMVAAVFWPLQEMLDRLLLPDDLVGGPLFLQTYTLPYFPLVITAIMLLLGYLDIYSQAIKDMDRLGEAFLPGDCFWDPLQMLQGAPDTMKRNMQERELFNGRAAMLAIAMYLIEELITGRAVVDIPSNALLLQPAYQIPAIQRWLDAQFSVTDPESAFFTPLDIGSIESLTTTLNIVWFSFLQLIYPGHFN